MLFRVGVRRLVKAFLQMGPLSRFWERGEILLENLENEKRQNKYRRFPPFIAST